MRPWLETNKNTKNKKRRIQFVDEVKKKYSLKNLPTHLQVAVIGETIFVVR